MNTKEMTQGAMACALYGVLLLLNQQTGLLIESTVSWIFIFPILIYTAMTQFKAGLMVGIAMAFETIFFGGFTTWFYSWTAIGIGFIYGYGIGKGWKNMTNLSILFILSCISYGVMIFLWSSLFGIDIQQDFISFQKVIPGIDITVFILAMIGFMSFLQSLVIHMATYLLCVRLQIPIVPFQPLYKIKSPRWVAIVSILIVIGFFFSQNVIECSKGVHNTFQLLLLIDVVVLIYYGVIFFSDFCVRKDKKKWVFFAILGSFIPGLQILWGSAGFCDCLFQVREKLDSR